MEPLDRDTTAALDKYLAQRSGEKPHVEIGANSQIRLGTVLLCLMVLIPLMITAGTWIGAVNSYMKNGWDIEYSREWGFEAERLNPAWKAPNVYTVKKNVKDNKNP